MTQAALAANSALPAYRTKPACDAAGVTKHAAGVLFVAPDGHVLLVHRSGDEANYKHHWALPGGGVEEGETPEMGADREVGEELGVRVEGGKKKLLDQRRTPNGSIFHTYAQPVAEKFAPKLNAEHSGYTWAPLDRLPTPIHPAVAATLKERVGMADDMSPEDWTGLRDGFSKWTREEEAEPEHAEDVICATDEALRLAMDRETVREKGPEGHLHVRRTPISKATVNPYKGSEIPNAEALGLDPGAVYHLLRDPDELRKAASTFNGKPLLRKHKPTSAQDHAGDLTVGATGTDAEFEDPYLYNSLVVWPQDDIDDIETDLKKELSSGYRYRAEMTPGVFRGMRYDGVMREIVGNHVALVKDGRAGPDVVVGDSKENLMKPTRLAALVLAATAAHAAPLLAMDSKVVLPKDLFTTITPKNFKDSKTALLAGVRAALTGQLRAGIAMDATMEGLAKAIDAFGGQLDEPVDMPMDDMAAVKPMVEEKAEAKPAAFDAEPFKNFLREKGMGEDDIAKACDMMPKAMAGDAEDPEAKKKAEEEKAKKDKEAEDTKKAMDNMVSKPAMDAAIAAAVDTVRKNERAIRVAIDAVRPFVGELSPSLAMDSAGDVYRHAAVMLNIPDAKTIHESALPTLIGMQPKAGAQPHNVSRLAMDEAGSKSFNERFEGAGRIGSA